MSPIADEISSSAARVTAATAPNLAPWPRFSAGLTAAAGLAVLTERERVSRHAGRGESKGDRSKE